MVQKPSKLRYEEKKLSKLKLELRRNLFLEIELYDFSIGEKKNNKLCGGGEEMQKDRKRTIPVYIIWFT